MENKSVLAMLLGGIAIGAVIMSFFSVVLIGGPKWHDRANLIVQHNGGYYRLVPVEPKMEYLPKDTKKGE